ncbi:hypothetical protein D3C77_453460 [compost metagenome]
MRCCAVPAKGSDLLHFRLVAADDQLAGIDIWLKNGHRSVIEKISVIVIRRSAEQLDVEWALAFFQPELLFDIRSLLHANLEVVEGCVVVDVLAFHDQAVISDDLDALIMGFLQHFSYRSAINGRDDEKIHAFSNHVLDLGHLIFDDILAVLQICAITQTLEFFYHVVAIVHPSL